MASCGLSTSLGQDEGSERDLKQGLTRRMVIASGLLALLVAVAFATLYFAISNTRDSELLARNSRLELAAADQLEKLVIDLETGARGFVITGEKRFLEPWQIARADLPAQARSLTNLTDDPEQAARAQQIVRTTRSYLREYSVPLVRAAQRGDASARSIAVTAEGRRRVDELRTLFDRFTEVESSILSDRQIDTDADARRAVIAAGAGLAGSVLLIVLFTSYLTRAIIRPVTRAAAMAGRLAGGDLSARMPETGTAEIAELEKSFNAMAGSLEESRRELQRLVDEHAALRRVATLVAQGAPELEVFEAVIGEVGELSGADLARLERYEADGTVTGVAGWSRDESQLSVGTRIALEGVSIAALVRESALPVRVDSFEGASGPIADEARNIGIRASVGCPIIVGGRVWGVIAASSKGESPFPPNTEQQIGEFTELVATAIANTESRADLIASRARVVAAADAMRRRIERDLHDGAQQRLVSLALELRGAEASVPPELPELRAQLSETARGLAETLEALQEISRGIHPAILSRGGVGSVLKLLARRSAVPVEIDFHADGRFPERVEVALYYVVSEALTNAAKHAKASVVHVEVEAHDGSVRLSIRDDGVGGADPRRGGSGLVGLRDRIETLGGTIEIASPVGGGTTLLISVPTDAD
jgi:signal transduction histidine kinase